MGSQVSSTPATDNPTTSVERDVNIKEVKNDGSVKDSIQNEPKVKHSSEEADNGAVEAEGKAVEEPEVIRASVDIPKVSKCKII